MWALQSVEGGDKGAGSVMCFLVHRETEYTVGRNEDCDVCLREKSVSRMHASLRVAAGQSTDSSTCLQLNLKNSSKFGTFVNGETLGTGEVILERVSNTIRSLTLLH
jgi:pSer/pThr/pTyr-binding forkhead associated (FHA) protein